uniref:BTB domain-containing protein n=1 Tax=Glossina brevipalpis TaxID=37001 RepID=A0A1A9WLU1_9MUSC
MNHLKWMGHSATILDIQKNLRSDLESCEVTLVAKGHSVKAHRFVLSSCSDLMRCLLTDIPMGQECTLMVPDIKGILLDSVLAFIYLGEACISAINLSEFLEAINVLGIKSAISFECHSNSSRNTSTDNVSSSSPTPVVTRVVGGSLTLSHEEMITHESITQKLEPANIIPAETSVTTANATNTANRDLEFLDVYHDLQNKFTYSIEHVPGVANGNEFILTENSGTYTLTQNPKLETASSTASGNMDTNEDEGVEIHISEEYSSNDENIMQLEESAPEVTVTNTNSSATHSDNTDNNVVEVKSKIKAIKLKSRTGTANTAKLDTTMDATNVSEDPISIIQTHEDFTILKENGNNENVGSNDSGASGLVNSSPSQTPIDLAYQAMVNEGLSLPKAAVKFNVSKTELWCRVRSTGVENYMSSAAESDSVRPMKKEDAIEMACQVVISDGLSLQKAAMKFDISKTVLWRRVRKHPDYMKTARENPIVTKAYERLKSGESLKSISLDLDIPMSTLHRHKVRLSQQGQLPDFVTCKRRDSTSKDDLKIKLAKAVHACVHKGMSQNHAANLYGISKSTLWRHLQKRVAEAEASEAAEQSTESMEEDEIKEEVILSTYPSSVQIAAALIN